MMINDLLNKTLGLFAISSSSLASLNHHVIVHIPCLKKTIMYEHKYSVSCTKGRYYMYVDNLLSYNTMLFYLEMVSAQYHNLHI